MEELLEYLICNWICSFPSCISFKPEEILISTQPSRTGAYWTALSKKSDKTIWSLIWSPQRVKVLISSGISWKSWMFLSLTTIMIWQIMASRTLPRRNSSLFISTWLLNQRKNWSSVEQSWTDYWDINA